MLALMSTLLNRSLRTAPGLRGIGKHWEMDSMSSEIDSESDVSHKAVSIERDAGEMKAETRLIVFPPRQQAKDETSLKPIKAKKLESKLTIKPDAKSKLKNPIKKVVKVTPKHLKASDESQKEGESDKEPSEKQSQAKKKPKGSALKKPSASALKKYNGSIKRKKSKDDDKNSDKNVVVKKRMASLNASAILAANYEIENYAAKHESSSSEASSSSGEEEETRKDAEPPTMKKEKKDVKMESEEVFLLLCYLFAFCLSLLWCAV